MPYVERQRDESYPLYIRTQAALARARLELGLIQPARNVLPSLRGILFRDQSLTAVDAWIAHVEGDHSSRDKLLLQLDSELTAAPPTLEFARSIARLKATMRDPSARATMIWKPDLL